MKKYTSTSTIITKQRNNCNECYKRAVQTLKDRILRNYKVAIPHWHENKIQLLLPLILSNEEKLS